MDDCTGKTITELWAWVALDPLDGNEGIPAFLDPLTNTMMPMIMADGERIKQLRRTAEMYAEISPTPVQLRKFSVMTVVDELPGKGAPGLKP